MLDTVFTQSKDERADKDRDHKRSRSRERKGSERERDRDEKRRRRDSPDRRSSDRRREERDRRDRDRDSKRENESEKSRKEKRQEKESEEKSSKGSEDKVGDEKGKEGVTGVRDNERDKDRERNRERDRERDRDRPRRDRSESRRRDRRADDRRRDRSKSRSRSRSRSGGRRGDRYRRERSYSPPSRRDRRRYSRDSRSPPSRRSRRDDDDKDKPSGSANSEEEPKYKQITLKDIITANPGISMPEAVVRLNAYNSAVVQNQVPPSISINGSSSTAAVAAAMATAAPGLSVSMLGALGTNLLPDGGAATKPHREIYIGNLPPGITMQQLAEFLNAAMKQLGYSKDLNSVVTAWVSPDGHYGFVEMRTMEEATAALQNLNGIQVGIYSLKIGRPKGYNPNAAIVGSALAVPMTSLSVVAPSAAPNPLLASLSLGVSEPMSNVLMVSNLPTLITEEQVKDIFKSFGEFAAFNLIRTPGSGTYVSQSAVFEYVQSSVADVVVEGMNGVEIGGSKISVTKVPLSSASVLLRPTQQVPVTVPTPTNAAATSVSNPVDDEEKRTLDTLLRLPTSRVIRLSNMTTEEDLTDNVAFEELTEDVAAECNKHGTVTKVIIPRTKGHPARGVIFVAFTEISGASQALQKIQGRKFNGKTVQAVNFPESLFFEQTYILPEDFDLDGAIASSTVATTAPTHVVTAADELD